MAPLSSGYSFLVKWEATKLFSQIGFDKVSCAHHISNPELFAVMFPKTTNIQRQVKLSVQKTYMIHYNCDTLSLI